MTNEQINQRIAEACGWKKMNWNEATVYGSPTHGFRVWKSKHQDSIMSYKGRVGERIPDYLNDLNAMHEAVKSLPQNLKPRYFACLCAVVSGAVALHGYSEATEATAAQRAEAFLRTLNQWNE